MGIVPLGHHVLVKIDEVETVSAGGIFIPSQVKDKQEESCIFGTIVAIGNNAWKAFDGGEPWAKVGDRISFAKYGGMVIEHPETKERFRVLNDDDIICLIN